MNRESTLCILFILTAFVNAAFVNIASADSGENFAARAPQISTTIVISQVYGGGGSSSGTYMNDYVELFNVSNAPQSLNGLALQYGSATGNFGGSSSNIFALPNATLQPGQHYLVQLGSAGSGGVALPVTPDAVTSSLNLSGSSGKIALTGTTNSLGCGATAAPCALPNPNIIDLVAYGAANNAEGGVTVNNGTALTSTQGSVRKNNGCVDTDNNNNDFTVIENPIPRNANSPLTPCGGGTPTPTATPTTTVTPTPTPNANADFNGDGKTDFAVIRSFSGSATWFISTNGAGALAAVQFGLSSDVPIPEDFDGDGKDDIAVWRSGAQAYFYILLSSNNTFAAVPFGQTGDDPKVVADYDGDKKADISVYRPSGSGQGYYYFISSGSGKLSSVPWGGGSTVRPDVGDYDGDGKADFCVYIDYEGKGLFALLKSSNKGEEYIRWGAVSDTVAPGDYDGDKRSDFVVVRNENGKKTWYILYRAGAFSTIEWGFPGDTLVPGDYDGDGKQDVAVWRPFAGSSSIYYARASSNNGLLSFSWGAATDYPVENWYARTPTNVNPLKNYFVK